MIQHVRRMIEWVIPANTEASIPLAALVQTSISGAFQATLRLSSLLQVGLVSAALHADPLHPQALMMLAATAWADRSTVSYLKVWHG